ncbi:MAG: hypothetical protein LCH56_09840 [Proteobacteria bacterium]|nr:hypothetical protein [Pseudomonadota bacterium]
MLRKVQNICTAAMFVAGLGASGAMADDTLQGPVRNRTISYATVTMHWSVYQTADAKAECPDGLNDYGPREVFKSYFGDGKGRSVVDTQLAREGFKYFPLDTEDKLPYHHAGGKISNGINLDGKVKDGDFVNQDGEKGVDNNLYRVIGCARIYRGPDGAIFFFATKQVRDYTFNRTMIEISEVDDLANDPDVSVTFYRGMDPLMQDASGALVVAGGTQRPDMKFGKRLIRRTKGKIENGMLLTDPIESMMVPWEVFPPVPDYLLMKGARFSLRLTPERAEGVLAGYADVEKMYAHATTWSTHHFSYGQHDAPRFYRELNKMADGYPDKDGKMTAISSALQLNMIQVFIDHGDDPKTADAAPLNQSKADPRADRE